MCAHILYRFHEDHSDENLTKKSMIDWLPTGLQMSLIRHLYEHEVFRVPVLAFIESVDKDNQAHHTLQEKFLNDVLINLEYRTFSPGEVIVPFSEHPASRLIIFVSGKVDVEFDHPSIEHGKMQLNAGDFIGDMAILNHTDWASSRCLGTSIFTYVYICTSIAPEPDEHAPGKGVSVVRRN